MPAPLPSALDPSAHRHRRGVFTPPASSIFNHFSTQYATTYQPTMKNTTKDGLPRTMKAVDSTSGATHNNVATTVIPRQRTTANEDIYKRSLPVPYHDASHPYASADSQRQSSIVEAVDEKGDPYTYVSHSPRTQTHPTTEMSDDGVTTLSYPPVSDYTARYVAPTAQQSQLEHETSSQPQKYHKNHVLPTHAVPSAIMSSAGGVDVNGHRHNKTAGGYVQNNYNAYFPGARLESDTSYSRSFTSANKHHTLPLSTPQRPSDNGYVRNNEYHNVAYGYDGDEMKSSYQMMLEDAHNAPRGDDIPVNKTALISHTELSGFTRGELVPPSQGVGTEDMKLRQLYRQRDRSHVMMTDAGQVMAPPVHTTQQGAFPTNERTGTERSEAQELSQLKHLKRVDPVEYQHRINGTSRYISTSQLVHSAGIRSSTMSTAREAGWDHDESELHDRDGMRHIRQGGLTQFYRTTSQKVNEETQQYKNMIDAQGKEIGVPQDTGFSTGNANLMSAYGHRPGGHAATYNPSQAYRSHSHATHTNPSDSDVGMIEPWRILDERPPSSSYTKLHTSDPLSHRPAYLSDMVSYSLDGSTFLDTRQNQTITRTEAGDRIVTRQLKPLSEALLHPTVKKIQSLQEPTPIKNYGQSHPQEEGLVALAQ